MYFYHEHFFDAHTAAKEYERSDASGEHLATEYLIRIPAILNWLAVTSVALCIIIAVILSLS